MNGSSTCHTRLMTLHASHGFAEVDSRHRLLIWRLLRVRMSRIALPAAFDALAAGGVKGMATKRMTEDTGLRLPLLEDSDEEVKTTTPRPIYL